MDVDQLVERHFQYQNPVIGKIYIEHLFTVSCIVNRQKEALKKSIDFNYISNEPGPDKKKFGSQLKFRPEMTHQNCLYQAFRSSVSNY